MQVRRHKEGEKRYILSTDEYNWQEFQGQWRFLTKEIRHR